MLALAVLVTACGSSSGSASSGSGGGATPQPAVGGGGDFCAVIRDQLNGLDKVFPKDFTSADQLKAYGTYLEETNNKVLAAAPAEIRADVETQVRVSNTAAASYKSGVIPPAAVTAQLRTAEYKTAAANLAKYAKDKCGISPSVAPTS
ncbi:MAG: hypothetical protein M3O87_03935 [Candidatus Dormibacteraeota bacterium]|nr:hypothetical protein [Candidatus Dormibacteraeota bacterium]